MVRTQVQFPDELYQGVKRIASEQEMTLAEVVRRGVEHMLRLYPPGRIDPQTWQPPAPRSLGAFLAPAGDWREIANLVDRERIEGE